MAMSGFISITGSGGWRGGSNRQVGCGAKAPVATGSMCCVDQVGDKEVQLRIETEFERLAPLDPVKTSEKIMVQTVNDIWRIFAQDPW